MSKRGYISRYLLIVKLLKNKKIATYEEIKEYIQKNLKEDLQVGFSKRTLQRDLMDIRNNFGFDIEYSSTKKGYEISPDNCEKLNFQRMMEVFEIFNSLSLAHEYESFIHVEKRNPQNTEHLSSLLKAIKNRKRIKFTYFKFEDEVYSERVAEPYAIKEFKNRWYVMAKDCKDTNIKSFALDRIINLETTEHPFDITEYIDIEQMYKFCYGIISPNNEEPEEIILSFEPYQGKFIKSLPLHHTQEVLIDNEKETRIKLKLFLTHDFIMELLSFGEYMKVIKPTKLVNQIRRIHEKAFKQY
jgi:predicted DNA-binding transcriptional regulator YafY